MIVFFSLLLGYIINLPQFLYNFVKDLIHYIKIRGWRLWDKWGLNLYVAKFGGGKTISVARYALQKAMHYKELTILSNITLKGFPEHTKILPLRTVDDIINAPDCTLVIIDEIGTIFNSRDFAGKKALPKELFQYLCQCRHRKIQIIGTVQRWNFLDKQLRDIADKVIVCRSHFPHPFSRIVSNTVYDAIDYDMAYTNPMYPLHGMIANVYIQTDKLRACYDTKEMVNTVMTYKFDPPAEDGSTQRNYNPADKKQQRRAVNNVHRVM